MQTFHFEYISKYRDELFGLSILSILLFHYSEDLYHAIQDGIIGMTPMYLKNRIFLDYYTWIRSIGVEIFVFLSGMGLYFSLSNNSNILSFYKRRFVRILPAYVIVGMIFWMIKDVFFGGEGVTEVLKDLSFITFFTEGVHTLWFIALILINVRRTLSTSVES